MKKEVANQLRRLHQDKEAYANLLKQEKRECPCCLKIPTYCRCNAKEFRNEILKGFVARINGDIALAHPKWQFNEIDKILDIIQERLAKEIKKK